MLLSYDELLMFASHWDLIPRNMVILTGTKQHLQGHVKVSSGHITHRPTHPSLRAVRGYNL